MFSSDLISVIVPVYNCENYLPEAIESVLSQTYRPIEAVVVDDGSTDNSANIARRCGPLVRYCFQSNKGTGAARNKGVELARGNYLAFLDQDDLWVKHKLTRQMTAFQSNITLDMVFGHVEQFYSPDVYEETEKQAWIPREIVPGIHVGTLLITRDAFRRVGPFGTNFEIAEFVDWYLRATESGLRRQMLPDVLMRRRIHKANQGIYKRKHRAEYVRVLKAALDRRRSLCL
jgi:glycosyltransferase involved in cell wall biosynthesis